MTPSAPHRYRKLSLKYHPDKDDSADAAVIFARVAKAYDVLSNSALKATFDVHGEQGLKHGAPDGRGGTKGGHYAFEVSPVSVFETFHGTTNPYSALIDVTDAFEKLGRTGYASRSDGDDGQQRVLRGHRERHRHAVSRAIGRGAVVQDGAVDECGSGGVDETAERGLDVDEIHPARRRELARFLRAQAWSAL